MADDEEEGEGGEDDAKYVEDRKKAKEEGGKKKKKKGFFGFGGGEKKEKKTEEEKKEEKAAADKAKANAQKIEEETKRVEEAEAAERLKAKKERQQELLKKDLDPSPRVFQFNMKVRSSATRNPSVPLCGVQHRWPQSILRGSLCAAGDEDPKRVEGGAEGHVLHGDAGRRLQGGGEARQGSRERGQKGTAVHHGPVEEGRRPRLSLRHWRGRLDSCRCRLSPTAYAHSRQLGLRARAPQFGAGVPIYWIGAYGDLEVQDFMIEIFTKKGMRSPIKKAEYRTPLSALAQSSIQQVPPRSPGRDARGKTLLTAWARFAVHGAAGDRIGGDQRGREAAICDHHNDHLLPGEMPVEASVGRSLGAPTRVPPLVATHFTGALSVPAQVYRLEWFQFACIGCTQA